MASAFSFLPLLQLNKSLPHGVIHFRGQIVEPPCEVSARQQNIDMTCVNNGQMKTNRFTLQQVTTAPQSLRQIASVRVNYLDPQQRLAIMSIEYQ